MKARAETVDSKRRQAVKALGAETSARQKLVSQALAAEKTGSEGKHVTFDSDEENVDVHAGTTTKNKLMLFDDDSSGNESELENQLRVRPEYEGKSGQDLMKRQLRITDSRFKMDARFNEGSDEDSEDDDDTAKDKISDQGAEGAEPDEDSIANEKRRAIDILGSIVGKDAVKKRKIGVNFQPTSRYDPSAADHDTYELKSVKTTKTKSKLDVKPEETEKSPEPQSVELPAKRFSEADLETLSSVFKDKKEKSSEAFTLFGGRIVSSDDDDDHEEDDDDCNKTAISTKKDSSKTRIVPVSSSKNVWDSSDTDEEMADIETAEKTEEPIKAVNNCFFYEENDPRLQAGMNFFFGQQKQDLRIMWLEKRQTIIEDYRQCRKVSLRRTKAVTRK